MLFLEDGLSVLGPLDEGLVAAAAAEAGLCSTSTAATVWYMLNSCGSKTADAASSAVELFSLTDGVNKLFDDAVVVVVDVIAVTLVVAALPFFALEALTTPPLLPRSLLVLALIRLSIALC